MGFLHYGEAQRFAFTDRELTHLRTVILGKFSLQESFAFTWHSAGSQHSIWLHPAIPLHFEFEDEFSPELNHFWIEHLQVLANSPGGLKLIEEPQEISR